MKSNFVVCHDLVGNIPSKILQDICFKKKDLTPCVVLVPGNPGEIEFYREFAEVLKNELENSISICGICHVGHHAQSKHFPRLPAISEAPDIYMLDGQIEHQVKFIQDYVGPKRKLFLIGHSIGAYIVLKLLERQVGNVKRSFLLFPTIERMGETPRAIKTRKFINAYRAFFRYMISLVFCLPSVIKNWIIRRLFREDHVVAGVKSFTASIDSLDACLNMALDEFDRVVHRPDDVIGHHLGSLSFYYGTIDHWCPISYYRDICEKYPHADITLDDRCTQHAFVMEDSKFMAQWVAQKLKTALE